MGSILCSKNGPKIGHFWGPKWSILATFGIKLGPKLAILGSKMGHLGVPTAPGSLGTPYLVAVYPPNMPIWAIWALLAIWVGNGVFYPFLVHFDHLGSKLTVRRSTVHGPNWSFLMHSDDIMMPTPKWGFGPLPGHGPGTPDPGCPGTRYGDHLRGPYLPL